MGREHQGAGSTSAPPHAWTTQRTESVQTQFWNFSVNGNICPFDRRRRLFCGPPSTHHPAHRWEGRANADGACESAVVVLVVVAVPLLLRLFGRLPDPSHPVPSLRRMASFEAFASSFGFFANQMGPHGVFGWTVKVEIHPRGAHASIARRNGGINPTGDRLRCSSSSRSFSASSSGSRSSGSESWGRKSHPRCHFGEFCTKKTLKTLCGTHTSVPFPGGRDPKGVKSLRLLDLGPG